MQAVRAAFHPRSSTRPTSPDLAVPPAVAQRHEAIVAEFQLERLKGLLCRSQSRSRLMRRARLARQCRVRIRSTAPGRSKR